MPGPFNSFIRCKTLDSPASSRPASRGASQSRQRRPSSRRDLSVTKCYTSIFPGENDEHTKASEEAFPQARF
ncbi:hypothetical protein E2C01_018634 [Portunus trituberculatus]|uniref:Uncharacterized protein n=1 Tax=Portunus trituberculatus TaxID=210409 RepID=A0A5B7DWZ1_PORTR|nr:hypothetical protein [Portunus trituberculatus]